MSRRGKRKPRKRRRGRGAAATRAGAGRTLGGLPLSVAAGHGLLHPRTGAEASGRVQASPAERAHVERLRADPAEWGPGHGSRGEPS